MYDGLLHLHNLLRWVILIFLLLSIFRQMTAGNDPFGKRDKAFGLPLLIAAHIQLLIGLYQYITGSWGLKMLEGNDMSTVMKNGAMRFWVIEHPIAMLLGVIFITIAYGQRKSRHTARVQHKRALIFYILALLVILAAVPWPGREVARPIFPGM